MVKIRKPSRYFCLYLCVIPLGLLGADTVVSDSKTFSAKTIPDIMVSSINANAKHKDFDTLKELGNAISKQLVGSVCTDEGYSISPTYKFTPQNQQLFDGYNLFYRVSCEFKDIARFNTTLSSVQKLVETKKYQDASVALAKVSWAVSKQRVAQVEDGLKRQAGAYSIDRKNMILPQDYTCALSALAINQPSYPVVPMMRNEAFVMSTRSVDVSEPAASEQEIRVQANFTYSCKK